MMIFKAPDILIPKDIYDYKKWSVVACDQFTSESEYWEQLDSECGDISTLRIVYPEVYLGKDEDNRIKNINKTMKKYLDDSIFREIKGSYILVERTTNYKHKRLGLMIAIDVEQYNFTPLSYAPIKATERTVIERIPVRVKIREGALLECPHIMLLMDDFKREIIEPLYRNRDKLEKLYDFDLNMNGGHLTGYKVTDIEAINSKLIKLIDKDVLTKKYGKADNPFLFAVGDGNHSLASAKACWDKIKGSIVDKENHPARYALCELVNLYDDDLIFEPIHRVMFNVDNAFIKQLITAFKGTGKANIVYNEVRTEFNINESVPMAIAEIQGFLDDYLKINKKASIDYIHGEENTIKVAKKQNGVAILMPTIRKNELFKYVLDKGVLCRKAFSMGEAEEKRYYMESKKIKV